jgi:prepilin-type N-terminal cleavage/methylation domain-containing protein
LTRKGLRPSSSPKKITTKLGVLKISKFEIVRNEFMPTYRQIEYVNLTNGLQRSFSLIELLVVVAILGILAAAGAYGWA